jgi:hypothetical protein
MKWSSSGGWESLTDWIRQSLISGVDRVQTIMLHPKLTNQDAVTGRQSTRFQWMSQDASARTMACHGAFVKFE